MKAFKAVTKIGGDSEGGNEFWMADMDTVDLSAARQAEPRRRRQSEIDAMNARNNKELPAGCSYNKFAVHEIRRSYVCNRLRESKEQFVAQQPVTVFCGTFNVNGKKEKEDDQGLGAWLQWKSDPDIYALGFQEIVDLNAVNVAVSDSKSLQRSLMWQASIESHLRLFNSKYKCIAQRTLVGVMLCIFVKEDLEAQLTDIQESEQRTGFGGTFGNKGGVAVRMQLYDSTLCFVCSHLAAHTKNIAGRNEDFSTIASKLEFQTKGDPVGQWEVRGLPQENLSNSGGKQAYGILDHDLVFWLGDLNYRIVEAAVPINEVFMRVKSPEGLQSLRANDQLNVERMNGRAFAGFQEGELRFLPTYKYEVGTNEYDRRPEKKLRAPAWCDRVLWHSQDPATDQVQLLSYHRAELTISDHKPVAAALLAQVRRIDPEQHQAAYQAVISDLDRYDTNLQPQISVSSHRVDLGVVRFRQTTTVTIRITNVGQSLAYFRFAPKLQEPAPAPTWLKVEPTFALLKPGDLVDVSFTALVDGAMAQALATGCAVLEEVLVLQLEQGPEYYLQVFGTYAQSAFGTPLAVLVARRDREVAIAVPMEIWRLLDGVVRRGGLTDPQVAGNLFAAQQDPNDADVAAATACLDSSDEFDPSCSAQTLVHVLQNLLKELPEPVVPTSAIQLAEDEFPDFVNRWPQRFLDSLPPVHHDVFIYLMLFLRDLLQARLQSVRGGDMSQDQTLYYQAQAVAAAAADMLHPASDDVNAAGPSSLSAADSSGTLILDGDDEGDMQAGTTSGSKLQQIIQYFLVSGMTAPLMAE